MPLVDIVLRWIDARSMPSLPWWVDLLLVSIMLLMVIASSLMAKAARLPRRTRIGSDDLVGGSPADMEASDRRTALEIADRLAQREFIHRRVERLTFQGYRTLRRHVSIDVEVMAGSPYIPIGLSRKDPNDETQIGLRNFSVSNDSSQALPLLGRRDNSRWTFYALAAWLERRVGEAIALVAGGTQGQFSLTNEEKRILWEIVSGSEAVSTKAFSLVISNVGAAEKLLTRVPVADWSSQIEELGPLGRIALALHLDQNLGVVLSRLATSWVMLVEAPPHDPGHRTIIKYSFDDMFAGQMSLKPWRRTFWVGLGWIPLVVEMPSVTSLPSQSVHIEFQSPSGLEIEAALLVSSGLALFGRHRVLGNSGHRRSARARERFFGALRGVAAYDRAADKIASDSEAGEHSDLSHVYLPAVSTADSLRAFVAMRIQRTPQVRSSILGAGLLAVFLWVGASVPTRFAAQADILILTVPSVLIGFLLFRQHEFVSQASRSLRALLSVAVGISILAFGLTVAAGSTYAQAIGNGFLILRWPATVIALLLVPLLLPNGALRREK